MRQKLGGLAAIIVAVLVLCLISVFEPPTYAQILCGIGGSIICLFGVVFLFAEGEISIRNLKSNEAPKIGSATKTTAA